MPEKDVKKQEEEEGIPSITLAAALGVHERLRWIEDKLREYGDKFKDIGEVNAKVLDDLKEVRDLIEPLKEKVEGLVEVNARLAESMEKWPDVLLTDAFRAAVKDFAKDKEISEDLAGFISWLEDRYRQYAFERWAKIWPKKEE